jgi:hypothetical protein
MDGGRRSSYRDVLLRGPGKSLRREARQPLNSLTQLLPLQLPANLGGPPPRKKATGIGFAVESQRHTFLTDPRRQLDACSRNTP